MLALSTMVQYYSRHGIASPDRLLRVACERSKEVIFQAISMKRVAIIQARMSSRRLPGKVLKLLGGQPLLGRMLARVRRAERLDDVVVASSTEPEDDVIAAYCSQAGVPLLRGPLENVAQRFSMAMEAWPADVYVRLCADSPLMDPAVIDAVVARFEAEKPDLATNVHPRSFPAGLSVEAINAATFRDAFPRFTTTPQREHVTRFFYEHADCYRIENVVNPSPLPPMDLSVNTEEQWQLLTRLWEAFGDRWDRLPWREAADFMLAHPTTRAGV